MTIPDFAWIFLLIVLLANRVACAEDEDHIPKYRMIMLKLYPHYFYDDGDHARCESKCSLEFSYTNELLSNYHVDKLPVNTSANEEYKRTKNVFSLGKFEKTLDFEISPSEDGLYEIRIFSVICSKNAAQSCYTAPGFTLNFSFSGTPINKENVVVYWNHKRRDISAHRFGFSYRMSCDKYLHGRLCDKYCKPADSVKRGHFNCDSDGNKHCLPGWQDLNSKCKQLVLAACDVNPCQNGGNCSAKMLDKNITWCTCPSDFAGFLCEKCKNGSFCQNGGICVPRNGTKTCDCTEGYSGKTCDEKINYCLEKVANETKNPCDNNGTCTSLPYTFKCDCPPGVSGKYCEIDIDECENKPCKHDERCVNTIGSYICFMANDTNNDKNGTEIADTKSDKNGTKIDDTKNEKNGANFSSLRQVSKSALLIGIAAVWLILRSV